MGFNNELEDIIDNINNIAQGYGFKNGIDWANEAQKRGIISWGQFKKYENAHDLRVRLAHGNARDINVSLETYQIAKHFEKDIESSLIRKNRQTSVNNKKQKPSNRTFRANTPAKNPNKTSYQDSYTKMYARLGNSLSRTAEEIQKELKIMRKYPKASYEDLVEAMYRIVKTYGPEDFALISSVYECHLKMSLFNKDAARKELAEKIVASLKDSELRTLMGN